VSDLLTEDKVRTASGPLSNWVTAQTSANAEGVAASPDSPLLITLPCDANLRAFMGGNLVVAALLQSYTLQGTTVPKAVCVHWLPASTAINAVISGVAYPTVAHQEPATAAQASLSEVRTHSGLTYEEIAPLLGVSRRTLHSWNNGSPISARRERKLRGLAEAVKAIASVCALPMRRFLFDRSDSGIRPYDLLAEGLYQEAVDAAAGRRPYTSAPQRPESETLASQLDRRDDAVSIKTGRLRPELSRRIR
jgi:transcriptional regulator with XRE-family HTH domain